MANITIRQGATGATGVKNAPLTVAELDQNFTNLNTFKVEQNTNGALIPGATGATGVAGQFRYNPAAQTFQGYGADGWGEISGGGLGSFIAVTSNTTADAGKQYLADTTAGSFTLTLPASPSIGNAVAIADGGNWGINNLIVARNGSTIEGSATNLTADVGGVIITLVYTGTTWKVHATV